jgi:hypothetical protein
VHAHTLHLLYEAVTCGVSYASIGHAA